MKMQRERERERERERGFSLVELSIVLVILGLLTGGILAGQSLIRASELRSVVSDFQRYVAATNTFRDKYFALPGDMANATSFWGTRAGGSNIACQQTIATTTGTCNSDGNGQINLIAGDASFGERFLFWQHLAYAGLIEGSYTGASGSAAAEVRQPGTNMPHGKVGQTTFIAGYLSLTSGNPNYFDNPYGFNILSISGANASGTINSNVLKPEEAWNIDTKLDDGMPGTGNVFTFKGSSSWSPGCATGDTSSASYALTLTDKICTLQMRLL